MRLLRPPIPFYCVSLLYLNFLLHSVAILARPTDSTNSQLIPSSHNHDASSEYLPAIIPHHSKRVITATYNNLGPWKMVLTSSSLLISSLTSTPPTVTVPASALTSFLSSVATRAAAKAASNTAEAAALDFGKGAVSLAFVLREGLGAPGATIPWSLVATVVGQIVRRVELGNPGSFRGRVTGPLGKNVQGKYLWIDIALVLGGKALVDGMDGEDIEWEII